MAERSATPLAKKLGIKESSVVGLVRAPDGFEEALGRLPDGAEVRRDGAEDADVVLFFAQSCAELDAALPRLTRTLAPTAALWIAWPKKSSGVATDLSDAVVQEAGLAAGLVDNKVAAIDAVWSGLRFVVRLKDRASWGSP